MIEHFLRNPWYQSGSIIAKLAVNLATAIWSVAVLLTDGVMPVTFYRGLATQTEEQIIAACFLCISILHTTWLALYLRPRRFGAVGYFMMLAWWSAMLLLVAIDPGPKYPLEMMGVAVVTVLAAYAFTSNPKYGNDGIPVP